MIFTNFFKNLKCDQSHPTFRGYFDQSFKVPLDQSQPLYGVRLTNFLVLKKTKAYSTLKSEQQHHEISIAMIHNYSYSVA